MNNIVELFNSKSREFISKQRWMIENKNLNNFETRKLSVPVITSELRNEYLNINIEAHLVNAIKSEISNDIIRKLTKDLFSTHKFDYLDLRPDGSLMNGRVYLEKLVNIILSNNFENLITTGLISSELQDSSAFSPYITTDNLKISGVPLCYGKLGGKVDIYNDPYMKYDDGRICLFDKVQFNIGEMKAYETVQISSISPKIMIEYDIAYSVGDSKLIFVIENENSEAYKQHKSLQRDIKIDNILDGNSL